MYNPGQAGMEKDGEGGWEEWEEGKSATERQSRKKIQEEVRKPKPKNAERQQKYHAEDASHLRTAAAVSVIAEISREVRQKHQRTAGEV